MITQNDTTDITKLGVTRDYNSDGLRGLFQKGTVRTPREGTAGSMLWKKGHVAIDGAYMERSHNKECRKVHRFRFQ